MENSTVTNLSYLNSMANGDEEFFKEMITLFLSQNPTEMAQLAEAIQEKDYTKIHHAAHKMKSSIRIMGIASLEPIISAIEEKAKNSEEIDTIAVLYNQAEPITKQAIAEAESLL